jgi:phosphoglucosamine mutase
MRQLFGTDGIRGVAGTAPLDPTTVYAVGLALAHQLRPGVIQDGVIGPRVIIGRDTRESSPWISKLLAAGLRAGGAEVESAGVVPTPAIAFLAHTHGFHAGVVISASHNPWQDNGIKLFGPDGQKLPDQTELAIEEVIFRHAISATPPSVGEVPALIDQSQYAQEYVDSLIAAVPGLQLNGLHLVIDCANGAAAAIAPNLFAHLGGDVTFLNITPDGRNINDHCGALHPAIVGAEVVRHHAELGITFDGDADRCMLAGTDGHVINGDAILLMAAHDLKKRGLLAGDLVVATTMSNMGLEAALKRSGISMARAQVGDRYVLELMQQKRAVLGGEQSGHILFPHLATTGDGLLTALVVLDLVVRTGKTVDELTADLKVFPQVIVNVKVREKRPLENIPSVVERIHAAEAELADSGRVVIRYSGTEALARVMIEAESEELMKHHADLIADAIRAELGVTQATSK